MPATRRVFDAALEVAREYALLPTIAARWHRYADALPDDECRERVLALHAEAALHSELMLADLRGLAESFGARGIRAIALKGSALLATGAVRRGERHLDDIDIWVEPASVEEARATALESGWRESPLAAGVAVDGRSGRAYFEERLHELVPLVSAQGTLLDLHWTLPDTHDSAEAFAAWWSRGAEVDGLGEVRVPSSGDLVNHLCEHAIIYHRLEPRYLPRHVVDCAAMERAEPGILAQLADLSTAAWLSRRLLEALAGPKGTELDPGQSPRGRPGDSALRATILPTPTLEAVMTEQARLRASAGRWADDLRHRPTLLLRRLLPTVEHMESREGRALGGLDLAGAHLRRWRDRLTGDG